MLIRVALIISIVCYQNISIAANNDVFDKINNIKGIETCESIDPKAANTFLIFNPSNYQNYYFRSECFQKVAVQNRDEKLCDQVKEYKSLFLDGSAISRDACLTAVRDQKNKDFERRVKPEDIHKIQKLEIQVTPAGDFALKIYPSGKRWGNYSVVIALLDNNQKSVGNLDKLETHLSDKTDFIFITVYKRKILELTGTSPSSHESYFLQATLKLLSDDTGELQRSNLSAAEKESVKAAPITF
jgi:hypothetical protein